MKKISIIILILLLIQSTIYASQGLPMDSYFAPQNPNPNTNFDIFIDKNLVHLTENLGYPEMRNSRTMVPKEGELMTVNIVFTQNGISKNYSIQVPFTTSGKDR